MADPTDDGTLHYFEPGGMDHVDPAAARNPFSHDIIRMFARQLFSYRTPGDGAAAVLIPDLAVEIPTVQNGGLSSDGLRYTILMRLGTHWDSAPPREVTAEDLIRGFKRMCNPVAGAGAISSFTSTIAGMAEFADGYRAALAGRVPTAAAMAEYQNSHDIAGLRALDAKTLGMELIQPANDMPTLLSVVSASPAPAEYDEFIPDSPEWMSNVRSCGPYRPTDYVPGKFLRMERNRIWRQNTDAIRQQHANSIEVRLAGVSDTEVGAPIESGTAGLSLGRTGGRC